MAIEGLAEFEGAVRRFTRNLIPTEVNKLQRQITLDALKRVVLRTATDQGDTKKGWQVTQNTLPTAAYKASRGPLSDGRSALTGLQAFGVVYISNNHEAAPVLEYGAFQPPNPGPSKKKGKGGKPIPGRTGRILVSGGYSVQTPQGMVAPTVAELRVAFP